MKNPTKEPTEKELKDAIKLAGREINEWSIFLMRAKRKLNKLLKKKETK